MQKGDDAGGDVMAMAMATVTMTTPTQNRHRRGPGTTWPRGTSTATHKSLSPLPSDSPDLFSSREAAEQAVNQAGSGFVKVKILMKLAQLKKGGGIRSRFQEPEAQPGEAGEVEVEAREDGKARGVHVHIASLLISNILFTNSPQKEENKLGHYRKGRVVGLNCGGVAPHHPMQANV
ncbi:hypothetical protein B0H17DRAFT_1145398 [Mycena rosella]|uniref:Uncharacterized protein n=1 Tax=Mycena rosella TaxID=1033263 RepID=A0AAD7CTK0_MYCRO|nr:hypothetical protein B0H17DRAFT_1145398 [Mycena rosella]